MSIYENCVHTFFSDYWFDRIALFRRRVVRGQNLIHGRQFRITPKEPTNGVYEGVTPVGWTGGVRLYRGNTGHLNYSRTPGRQSIRGHPEQLEQSQTFNVVNAGLYLLTWYDNSLEQGAYQNTVTIKSASATLLQVDDAANARPLWNEHTAEVALGPRRRHAAISRAANWAEPICSITSVSCKSPTPQIPRIALLLIAFAGSPEPPESSPAHLNICRRRSAPQKSRSRRREESLW